MLILEINNVVNQTGINVITYSAGNMSTDVPTDLLYYVANKISTRIGIIDRLITTHGQEINELLQKGLNIKNQLKVQNPHYVSQLYEKSFRAYNFLFLL